MKRHLWWVGLAVTLVTLFGTAFGRAVLAESKANEAYAKVQALEADKAPAAERLGRLEEKVDNVGKSIESVGQRLDKQSDTLLKILSRQK
jgi:peptidoglycan hydrolase CwlO-like protein